MLAKRIIPCLDVRDGRVVKGVNFVNIRDAGDPVELATYYSQQGADEIVFLDITATYEARKTVADVVRKTVQQVFVPVTVGGGIRTLEDFQELLRAGADKISVNSAAVKDPTLISRAAERFGSQCVVLAIDARRREDGSYEVVVAGGRTPTGLDAIEWAKKGEALGAGEILLTSMDADGTKKRPIMLHRVCFGSIERFIGILIEHFAGKFPTWLAPVQVKVLPVSEKTLEYAEAITEKLVEAGVRVALDDDNQKIGYKIRAAQQVDRVPYMLVLGAKEAEAGNISVRDRKGETTEMSLEDFIAKVTTEIRTRSL